MAKKPDSNDYIYKIRNKLDGKYFQGYSSFGDIGGAREFKSELSARGSLDYFISSRVNHAFLNSKEKITKAMITKNFPYELEIVKIQVIHKEVAQVGLLTHINNVLIANRLEDVGKGYSFDFTYFWENAMKKGYADQIEYIIKLNPSKGVTTMTMIKEARAGLRNLGVKTRTFREFSGMFGFYNKDQAMKARLTLDALDFIDVAALRKEMFE